MARKYRFFCPHCGKEQIKEFHGGNLGYCGECGEPYGFMMTGRDDMYVFKLEKAERLENNRED